MSEIVKDIELERFLERKDIVNEGQTLLTLKDFELDMDEKNKPTLYVDGSFEPFFNVESPTKVRLGTSFPVGTPCYVLQYKIKEA